MTTTTIDERLDRIKGMGEENQALLDSIKANAAPPTSASPLTFTWAAFFMGAGTGATVVAIAATLF